MSALDLLREPVWQSLTWTLLHFLWQGLALAVAVATLLYVWPVRRAQNRYLIYLSALIAMAACPLVTFMVIGVPESPVVASREVEMEASLSPAPSAEPELEYVASEIEIEPTISAVQESQPSVEFSEPAAPETGDSASLPMPETGEAQPPPTIDAIQPYAVVVWIGGVLLLAVRLSMSWFHVRWLAWGCRMVPADLAARAAMLGRRLGLRFPPRVCISEKIREAIVVGLWRPLVLLPASWLTEMTPEVLEAVIAHELAHVRRLDLWVNLLQRLMETLLFYHPAVWWLSRRVSLQREMCADELAVGATSERLQYATALEQLGRMRLGQTTPQFGAGIGGKKMVLLSRVGNILGTSPSNKQARWWPVALLAMAVPLAIWAASTSLVSSTANEIRAGEVVDGASGSPISEEDKSKLRAPIPESDFVSQVWNRLNAWDAYIESVRDPLSDDPGYPTSQRARTAEEWKALERTEHFKARAQFAVWLADELLPACRRHGQTIRQRLGEREFEKRTFAEKSELHLLVTNHVGLHGRAINLTRTHLTGFSRYIELTDYASEEVLWDLFDSQERGQELFRAVGDTKMAASSIKASRARRTWLTKVYRGRSPMRLANRWKDLSRYVGRVVDVSGKPVAGAALTFMEQGPERVLLSRVVSDDEGRFFFPAVTPLQVFVGRVEAEGYRSRKTVDVLRRDDETFHPSEIELNRVEEGFDAAADTSTTDSTTETDIQDRRSDLLQEDADQFVFSLEYRGAQDKPYHSLLLEGPATPPRGPLAVGWIGTRLNKEQVLKLIEHLKMEGFLKNAHNIALKDLAFPKGPTYTLIVRGPKKLELYEVLGWDLKMVQRLDGIAAVLDGNAASEMKALLGRLAWNRKEWETPEVDLATLRERSTDAGGGTGSQDAFWEILKLRKTGTADAVPVLADILSDHVDSGRIHAHAAEQALYCIGTPEALRTLDRQLLGDNYDILRGFKYTHHWKMAEPQRSRFINRYLLPNLSNNLAIEVKALPAADEKGRIDFTVTVKNISRKAFQFRDRQFYQGRMLFLRSADGRFVESIEYVSYDPLMPKWIQLKPGQTHSYKFTARLLETPSNLGHFTDSPHVLDTGDILFLIDEPGTFEVIAALQDQPMTDEWAAENDLSNPWSGRAVSKPIRIELDSRNAVGQPPTTAADEVKPSEEEVARTAEIASLRKQQILLITQLAKVQTEHNHTQQQLAVAQQTKTDDHPEVKSLKDLLDARNEQLNHLKQQSEQLRERLEQLELRTQDKGRAEEAAAVPAAKRYHEIAEFQLEAGFKPDKTEIMLGEDMDFTFYVKNVGEKVFYLETGGDGRGIRSTRFSITAVDAEGNKAFDPNENSQNFGGLMGGPPAVEPGQSYTRKMTLSKWCRFDKPGTYTVTGKRTLNLSREKGLSTSRGDGPLDKPISDSFTITVLEPTPEQARDKVEQMMKNREGANFGVLNHPVYLPILLEYARKGDLDAVGGIGGILTPEATRARIELAEQWLDDGKLGPALATLNTLMLPDPRFKRDKEYSSPQLHVLDRAWRPEFAEPLRRMAKILVRNTDQGSLEKAGYILECVGKAEDLPAMMVGYTNAIEATKRLPFETHQYFRPRGASYRYRFTTRRLLERGGKAPENPATLGEMATYLIAMQRDETFRPTGWPEQVVRWLRCDTPYMKEFVLDHMPEPIPAAALELLPGLLADEYVDLQIAACKVAGKHPRETFKEPLLKILRTEPRGPFGILLNVAAGASPANGIPQDRVMEIWTERLDPTDLGHNAVIRLLLSILEDNKAFTPKLAAEHVPQIRKRWLRFIDENREKLRAGHRFKIGDPEITPDLFFPGFQFHHEGKVWPSDDAAASSPGSADAAIRKRTLDLSDEVSLPGGMSVKILGVRSPHQDDSIRWYAPDGSGEVEMPYAHSILDESFFDDEGYDVGQYTVALQVTGVPADAQNTYADRSTFFMATGEGNALPWFEGKGPDRTMYIFLPHQPAEALASRFLFVPQPQWHDIGHFRSDKTDKVLTVNQFAGMPPAEFRLVGIADKNAETVVTFHERGREVLTHDGRLVRNYEIAMFAIDKAGVEHGRKQGPGYSSLGGSREGTFTFDLAVEKIVSIRLKVRPYHWVEFQHISAGPDDKTDLKAILRRAVSDTEAAVLKSLAGRVWRVKRDEQNRVNEVWISPWASAAEFASLKELPKLETLSISMRVDRKSGLGELKLGDADLVHLQEMTNLKYLLMLGTEIGDAGLAHLKGLNQLEGLHLKGERITDDGLKHLEGLTNLRGLSLRRTAVTDAGLPNLKHLTKLVFLDVRGTKVTEEGLKQLQQAMPRLEVIRYGSPDSADVVSRTENETWAEEGADLKIEARIVGVGGKSPERCSITFWKAIDSESVEKTAGNPVGSRFSIPHVWRNSVTGGNSVTGKTWQPIHHFGANDSATSEELGPGDYRVTATLGHGNPTMIGVSDLIRLDGSREHTVVTLAMEAGPSLTIDILDAKTGEPIEYAAIRLVRPDGLPVVSWSSGAWSIHPRGNQHKFEHLAPGDYTLEVFKQAYQYGQNEYAAEQMPMKVRLAAGEDRRIAVKLKAVGPSEEEARRRWPWSVTGTVTDEKGQPVEGVEIRASCGMGSLMPTGSTTSDDQGRYTLRFGPGMRSRNESTGTWGAGLQAATIHASKPGHTEKNLGRQGGLMMADELPPKDNAWSAKPGEIVLPNKPHRLDFVMVPSAAIEGELIDEQGKPIADRRVSVHGKQMLPSTSVLAQGTTDKQGRFRFEGIPTNYAWWFDIQDQGRTEPISLPGPGSYRVKMQTVHDARYNVNTVRIIGVTNPKDAEIRDHVVGDDPSVRPPVSDELQQQGREYLRKMAAACGGWIGPPPSAIKNYEYRFQLGDQPPETIEVKEPSRAGHTTRQGIYYVGTPHVLATRPEKVVFRQVETVGETIQLRFLVQDAVKIAAGNGITGRFHGFFSSPLREGLLVLDKHTYRPLRTEIGDELRETFSQYVNLGDGRSGPRRFVPLLIQIKRGSHDWDWRFRVYQPGLWLLAESRSGDEVMLTNDEVKVNGEPAVTMHEDEASAWGRLAEGVQSRLRLGEFRDGVQWLRFDVRNNSRDRSVQLGPGGMPMEILLDNIPYEFRGEIAGQCPVCKPGQSITSGEFRLDNNWMPTKSAGGPGTLELKPGQHTVQAIVYAAAKDVEQTGRKARVTSNPVEIEVPPPKETAEVSTLQDVRTLADLRQCKEFKVDDTPWRVRIGLGDGGDEAGPWKLVYCLANYTEDGDATLSHKGDMVGQMLGPVFLEVLAADAEHGPPSGSIVMQSTLPGRECLFAAVVPTAWEGTYRLGVRSPSGHLLAERRLQVTDPSPCYWAEFAMKRDRAAPGKPTWLVNGNATAARPNYSGVRPLFVFDNGKLANHLEQRGLPGTIPLHHEWQSLFGIKRVSLKIGEAPPPLLHLSQADGILTIDSDVKMLTWADLHLLARWWVNDKPVLPPRSNGVRMIGLGRLVTYGNRMQVSLALPDMLGRVKVDDRVALQVLYVPGRIGQLPRNGIPGGMLRTLSSAGPDASMPLLSNRLELKIAPAAAVGHDN